MRPVPSSTSTWRDGSSCARCSAPRSSSTPTTRRCSPNCSTGTSPCASRHRWTGPDVVCRRTVTGPAGPGWTAQGWTGDELEQGRAGTGAARSGRRPATARGADRRPVRRTRRRRRAPSATTSTGCCGRSTSRRSCRPPSLGRRREGETGRPGGTRCPGRIAAGDDRRRDPRSARATRRSIDRTSSRDVPPIPSTSSWPAPRRASSTTSAPRSARSPAASRRSCATGDSRAVAGGSTCAARSTARSPTAGSRSTSSTVALGPIVRNCSCSATCRDRWPTSPGSR